MQPYRKGFLCFDPSSRSRRPGMLPSMSTSSSTPPYFSISLLDQHLLLRILWFFLRLPCIRGSQSPKEIRVAALYWAASFGSSSNNKELPASLSSSSNDQLPTDSSSSSIAAEPSPSLRLNGSPRPCSKGKVIYLNRARDIRRKRMTRWKALFPPPEDQYFSINTMWIGSLSPHPASSSINIRSFGSL